MLVKDRINTIDKFLQTEIGNLSVSNIVKRMDISVGKGPTSIAINPDTNTVYVTNTVDNTVSVINGNNYTKITDIPLGKKPTSIAINQDTNTVYVLGYQFNTLNNTVSVINGNNYTKITDIPVGKEPTSIAIHQDTNTVYVANSYVDNEPIGCGDDITSNNNTLSVINGNNYTKITDIPVGKKPTSIAINQDTNTVYVANHLSNNITVIDGNNYTKITDIPIGAVVTPDNVAINQDTNTVYVTNSFCFDNFNKYSISVIDGNYNKEITIIGIEDKPLGIDIENDTNTVYVTNPMFGSVSAIMDMPTHVSEKSNIKRIDIPVGKKPTSIAINQEADMLYVTNYRSNTVSIIFDIDIKTMVIEIQNLPHTY